MNEMEQLKRENAAMRHCCELAAKLSTSQGCPQENHAVVVAAMDALSDTAGSDLVTSASIPDAKLCGKHGLKSYRDLEGDVDQLRQQLAEANQRAEKAEAEIEEVCEALYCSRAHDDWSPTHVITQLRADKEKAEKACAQYAIDHPTTYYQCGRPDDIDELLALLQSIVSAQHNAKGWVERLEGAKKEPK